jgi:protein tyrosine/serine phosphatase
MGDVQMDLHHRLGLIVLLAVLPLQGCRLSKNFHVVQENALYRSAQLDREELEQAIDHFHIKTVINLRGERPGQKWYDDEADVAAGHGVELINIGMSPDRLPHRDDLIKLLDAFKTAERPILIHCQAGADRTGEAVAIYQMEYMGKSRENALKSLTPKYNHYSLVKPAKRYFIKRWVSEHWARNVYDPCVQEYSYYDQAANCGSGSPLPEEEVEEILE